MKVWVFPMAEWGMALQPLALGAQHQCVRTILVLVPVSSTKTSRWASTPHPAWLALGDPFAARSRHVRAILFRCQQCFFITIANRPEPARQRGWVYSVIPTVASSQASSAIVISGFSAIRRSRKQRCGSSLE